MVLEEEVFCKEESVDARRLSEGITIIMIMGVAPGDVLDLQGTDDDNLFG